MPREIIMPALGMAQDSGVIVQWLKAPGDKIAEGDALFEVETDKATMEVEAQSAGYLADVRAAAGAEVPVGEVIAVIADAPGEAAALPATEDIAPPDAPSDAVAEERGTAPEPAAFPPAAIAEPARNPATARRGTASSSTGRIFASPKSRRLAAEAGLDLSRLVAAGYPQPYHAADIEILRKLSDGSAQAASVTSARQITARASAAPGRELLDWLEHAEGRKLAASQLWLRFAAAALRQALQAEDDLVIELAPVGAAATRLRNPDRTGLANDPEAAQEASPDLILRDLSASAITGLHLGATEAPTLSVLAEGDALTITVEFDPSQLGDTTAIMLVAGFAERLNDPLTQLL